MAKQEKFVPRDSDQVPREDNQTVPDDTEKGHRQPEAKTQKPALKRKFSEQPPTNRNAKT